MALKAISPQPMGGMVVQPRRGMGRKRTPAQISIHQTKAERSRLCLSATWVTTWNPADVRTSRMAKDVIGHASHVHHPDSGQWSVVSGQCKRFNSSLTTGHWPLITGYALR